MNWFAWRQHRKQYIIFGIVLAVFAAVLIPTGVHFWHTYQHALSTCASYATPSDPQGQCDQLPDLLFQGDGAIFDGVVLSAFALPALLGMFIGSPLLAREYEEGTNKLAWTQGTARRKWLTVKLAWALGFALLYGVALTALVTWWSRTPDALYQNRFPQGHFETQGLMPVAYSIFFTVIGFTAGAWFRKTLVAIGITLGVFALCLVSFAQWIRPHYMTPVTVTAPVGPDALDSKIPTGAWMLSRDIVDKSGRAFDSFTPASMPPQCQQTLQNMRANKAAGIVTQTAGKPGDDPLNDCLNAAGYHQAAVYQPGYRYWDFQRIEAGIYLGMAAVATAATYLLVLKRDA